METETTDAFGNALTHGDSVQTTKELKVKGSKITLKKGTVIKSIRLTDNPDEVNCTHPEIKGLVLRTEFLKKR